MTIKSNHGTLSGIIGSAPLVLVDFFAEWCGPCKMMQPILEEVKSELGDMLRVLKVDVDKNIRAASRYQVASIPTLILFKHGQIVWRHSGVAAPSVLRKVLRSNL